MKTLFCWFVVLIGGRFVAITQLSKDLANKVAGSEQKYVEYIDKYPTLLKDAEVKVMYEKCKAKINKK